MNVYLLDTNAFIFPYRAPYRMDEFPGVWDWLEEKALNGDIASIAQVRDEILKPAELVEWIDAKLPDGFFRPSDSAVEAALPDVYRWVDANPLYGRQQIKEEFKGDADAYLIAHGLAHGDSVVTYEVPERSTTPSKAEIKIPDVADALGVESMPLHDLFRELGATFVQGPSRR